MKSTIAVLGIGAWGTALGMLLARNGHTVRMWGHEPEQVDAINRDRENKLFLPGYPIPDSPGSMEFTNDLAACLSGIRDVLIVVPSHVFRSVLVSMQPHLEPNARIMWGTKGIEAQTRKLLSQVVVEEMGDAVSMALIAGPSFAKDVAANLPTAVSVGSNDEVFARDVVEMFHNPHFRVYINRDMIGMQIGAAVKNVLAIAVGIADSMEMGANTRAALMTRGLAGMTRLTEALGGNPATMLGLAGVGDLILTCTDNQSRNRRFGLAIGRDIGCEQALTEIGQVVEGLDNTQQIYEMAQGLGIDMPIVEQVHAILFGGRKPETVIQELLEREPKAEF